MLTNRQFKEMKIVLFVFLAFLANVTIAYAQPHDQLGGFVEIMPNDGFMRANLTYHYVPRSSANTAATFYLPRTVTVTSLTSPNGNRYQEIVDSLPYTKIKRVWVDF